MKRLFLVVCTLPFATLLAAREPAGKKPSTVPGKYPPIIQIPAAEPSMPGAPTAIFQTELGGREVEFLQRARRYALQLSALAEIAKGKESSEQIKSVGAMLASMQTTESGKLEALAASKKLPPATANTDKLNDQLAELTGPRFEKAWVERLITVTDGSVQAYEVGAKSSDAEVRSFVEQMLPVAKARLQMANRLGGRSVAVPTPVPVAARPPATTPVATPASKAASNDPAPIAPPIPAAPATPVAPPKK